LGRYRGIGGRHEMNEIVDSPRKNIYLFAAAAAQDWQERWSNPGRRKLW
jgi:hypothetical protein